MSFRWFPALLLALLFFTGCDRELPNSISPDIIIISIDTLRADHLGCYGYQKATSPVLDMIAAQGLLFENATAPSPWTLPTHMSLLTGLYPSRHAVKSDYTQLSNDIETLASVFSEHGFATAAIVNSLYLDKRFGFAKGFDSYTRIPESPSAEGAAPKINALAMKWLRQRPNKPFFLFLHYYDVHSDYTPLPQFKKQFVGSYNGIADGTTAQLLQFRKGHVSLNQEDIQHISDLYDGEIRQLDDRLNCFFTFLQKQGLWDNTLLIATSDHGEEFFEHGGVLHGRTQYQELVHVPLIMRGPDIPKSKRIKGNVSLVDVMPTVLRHLGITPPEAHDGINLQPTWRQRNNILPSRFIFAEADHNNIRNDIKRAVLHQRYKLHYDLLSRKTQLYDLAEDPGERHDFAKKETSTANLLFRQLKQFMQVENKGQPLGAFSPEEINRLRGLGYLE